MKKNAVIFGDSYSTFQGWIPQGYATYYSPADRPETDVRRVEETWWHQVIRKVDMNLVLNDSWSGSTISYYGYNRVDCSCTSSFIYRLRRLIEDDFFRSNKIDTVFVFGGTNDSWAETPLGQPQMSGWQEDDLYSVQPAICYFVYLLRKVLPDAEIYCLINTQLKPEIGECFKKACAEFGGVAVEFDGIDKRSGHPTIQGMKNISDGVLQAMNK